MKIKHGFTLKRQDGQNFVVCNDKNFSSTIALSDYGAFLFEALSESERTKEELFNLLTAKYDISTVLALNDINIFIKTLKENGVIEE